MACRATLKCRSLPKWIHFQEPKTVQMIPQERIRALAETDQPASIKLRDTLSRTKMKEASAFVEASVLGSFDLGPRLMKTREEGHSPGRRHRRMGEQYRQIGGGHARHELDGQDPPDFRAGPKWRDISIRLVSIRKRREIPSPSADCVAMSLRGSETTEGRYDPRSLRSLSMTNYDCDTAS